MAEEPKDSTAQSSESSSKESSPKDTKQSLDKRLTEGKKDSGGLLFDPGDPGPNPFQQTDPAPSPPPPPDTQGSQADEAGSTAPSGESE